MQTQIKASAQCDSATRLSKHCMSSGKVSNALSNKVMQLSDTLRQFLLKKSSGEQLTSHAAAPTTGRAVSPCISKSVGPMLHSSPATTKQHKDNITGPSLSSRAQQLQRTQTSAFTLPQVAPRAKSTDRSHSAQRTHPLVRCGAAQSIVSEVQPAAAAKSSLAVKQTLASRSREMFSQKKLVSTALESNEEFVKQSTVLPTYQQTKLKQRVVEAATAARLSAPSHLMCPAIHEDNDVTLSCTGAAPSREHRLFSRLHSTTARSSSAPGRSSSSQRTPQSTIEVVVLAKPREPIRHRKLATSNPSPATSMPRDCGSTFVRPPAVPSKARDGGWRQPTPAPSTGNTVVRVLSSGVRVGITYAPNNSGNRNGSPTAAKPATVSTTLHRQAKKSVLSLSGSLLKERLQGPRSEPPPARVVSSVAAKEKVQPQQPQVARFSKKSCAVALSALVKDETKDDIAPHGGGKGPNEGTAPLIADDSAVSPMSSRSNSPRQQRISWRRNVEVFEPIPVADLHRFCAVSPRGRDVTPPTARGGVIFERIPIQLEKPKPVALYTPPHSIQAICQRVRGEVCSGD